MVEVRGQPWDLWEREVAVSLLFGLVAAPLALVAVAVFSAGSLGLRVRGNAGFHLALLSRCCRIVFTFLLWGQKTNQACEWRLRRRYGLTLHEDFFAGFHQDLNGFPRPVGPLPGVNEIFNRVTDTFQGLALKRGGAPVLISMLPCHFCLTISTARNCSCAKAGDVCSLSAML